MFIYFLVPVNFDDFTNRESGVAFESCSNIKYNDNMMFIVTTIISTTTNYAC